LSGILFHIFWSGNYLVWLVNPLNCIFISHSIYDVYLGSYFLDVFIFLQSTYSVILFYSGVYNLLYTLGVSSIFSLFILILVLQSISLLLIVIFIWHLQLNFVCLFRFRRLNLLLPSYYFNFILVILGLFSFRLSYYIGFLFGVLFILWSGHMVHSALPVSRGVYLFILLFIIFSLKNLFYFNWCFYVLNFDFIFHLFG
jgi:hypothetical protein